MKLVIVETPAQAKILTDSLGGGWRVEPCDGFVRDLPTDKLGIDVDDDFRPTFAVVPGKGNLVRRLMKAIRESEAVYAATPPTLAGEAMAWQALALSSDAKAKPIYRVTLPALTPDTIRAAFAAPRPLDIHLVEAEVTQRIVNPQVTCHITRTTARTHAIINSNLHRSPMYSGQIASIGPRYCPSIEDKIVRFGDRDGHQIFLEPEGLDTHEVYPNGISTSLPFDVQLALVRSMRGLENAHILRPGYAIEYDYFDPRALRSSFETRAIGGLFFAGQINGTTGYEEAAAQGLFAGINAALQCRGEAPWLPRRDEAYLGVLVDDLVTQGVTEPYRMFTSRAEFRLQLREDNADMRLTDTGRRLGLIDDARWGAFCRKRDAVSRETERLKSTWVNPRQLPASESERVLGKAIEHEHNLFDLLRRPGVSHAALVGLEGGRYASAEVSRETLGELWAPVIEQVEIAAKYAGYIDRQREEVERAAHFEHLRLPPDLDYMQVPALSIEVRQKLNLHRPETLGQASRISGVTPAAISLLLIHLKKGGFKGFAGGGAAEAA